MKQEIVYAKENKNLMAKYVHQRVKRNKNFLCAVTGPTGSGKTYSALRMAELIDPNFKEENIVFSMEEFIELLNSGKLKSGSVIIFEEAGVAVNSRKWQSFENNMIQFILQTFRHRNYIVFFTAPDFGFIDAASRKLMHAHFQTAGINQKRQFCIIKPFMLQVNQRTGKVFYKYLKAQVKGIGSKKISRTNVGMPTKELLKVYEAKKSKFTRELNEGIQAKMEERKKSAIKEDPTLKGKIEKVKAIENLRNNDMKWKDIGTIYSASSEAIRKWFSSNLHLVGGGEENYN